MSQDEFTRLFNYMVQRFDELEARFDSVDQQLGDVRAHFDALHGKADTDDTERLVMAHQLNRHQDWIEAAGKQIGVRYDPAG